jgi:hypothetical protein
VRVFAHEPFMVVLSPFCHRLDLPAERASLVFDGRALELTRSPAYYEMEDDDLIDLVIK